MREAVPAEPLDRSQSLLSVSDRDPFSFYESLRGQGPIQWDGVMKAWLVLNYEFCKAVEIDEDTFQNAYVNPCPASIAIKGGAQNITILQGDDHTRMRHFHMTLFTRQAMESYRRNHIEPIVETLLDRLDGERGDLAAEFSEKLPTRVIASLMGLPWRDDALMARVLFLHQEIMLWIALRHSDDGYEQRALSASEELSAIIGPFVIASKNNPRDDMIGRVWCEAPGGMQDLTVDGAMAICREIFFGGSDTTVHALSNAFHILITDGASRDAVQNGDDKVLAAFVEEVLRLYGSVQYRVRTVRRACRLGEVELAQGDTVILVHGAANRDPEIYSCPASLKLDRSRPQDHFAFNKGPRACIGAPLARAEMECAIRGLLRRYKNVRRDANAPPASFQGFYTRSFAPLNVVLGK